MMNPNKHFIAAQPAALTYSSTQATNCAVCGKHRHTPLRIDAMGGYICLTCIDHKLCEMLGEFGYSAPQKPMPDDELDLLCEKALFGRVSYQQLARSVEQHHGIGIPSPAWCASVDAELAATAEADAQPVKHVEVQMRVGRRGAWRKVDGGLQRAEYLLRTHPNVYEMRKLYAVPMTIASCNAPAPTLPAAAVAEGLERDGDALEQAS